MGTPGLGLYCLYKGTGLKRFKESERNDALLNGYWETPAEALAAMSEPVEMPTTVATPHAADPRDHPIEPDSL